MLKVENLDTYYGGSQVLFGVSLEVKDGEIISVLGRNGAGKTTLIKSIIGLVKSRHGTVKLDGHTLTGRTPEDIARAGVAYVPDDKRLFPYLTVRENLQVSALGTGDPNCSFEFILEYFPALKPFMQRKAGSLSGGEQQMLTIARALMRKPALALMDEPSQGLAPFVVESLKQAILDLNKENNTAFLVVEQEMHFATGVAKRLYGLLTGSVCYEGTTEHFYKTKAYEKFLAVVEE